MGTADEEPGCALAGALLARHFDGRFPGGLGGLAWQGRAEPVAFGDFPAGRGMAGRIRSLAGARSLGAALRVPLGGWRLPASPDGRQCRMHAGADRRDPRRQEGTRGLPGRRAGERSELARTARRGEAAWIEERSGNCRRRWRARLLESAQRDLRGHTASAMLGAQDRERIEQGRTLSATRHEEGPARGLAFAEPRGCGGGDRRLRRKYGAKYPKAVECLTKDRQPLLAFYDFPAEHWDHLRTSNPIESVFSTVRHRTVRTRGSLSSATAKLMVFKLVIAASKTWHRLNGEKQLPKVIEGVRFIDGIEVI